MRSKAQLKARIRGRSAPPAGPNVAALALTDADLRDLRWVVSVLGHATGDDMGKASEIVQRVLGKVGQGATLWFEPRG